MKNLTICLTLFVCTLPAAAQINAYAAVTAISGTTLSLTGVNQTYHSFIAGEQIIVMQMQDNVAGSNTSNTSNYGSINSIASAGYYEVATISSVAGLPNSLTITSALSHTYNFNSASSVQIISFRKYGSPNYTTTAAITALPWNGQIGGVVAMQVTGKLTVAYPISANGAGFRGGAVSSNYEVNCEATVYASASSNYAARGEGIMVNNTGLLYGRNALASGGGGGSDDNGGGGGGSNFSAGGQGGAGWTCTATPVGGFGGNSLASYVGASRVFMGGGGGGGQQNNSIGTAGANGGGIVIIKVGTLATSCSGSVTISADGASAGNSGNDGAGGGGAGGAVLVNAANITVPASCPLTVQGNGGSGGSVQNAGAHGGGGGGAQGVVLYPGAAPSNNVTTATTNGTGGTNSNSAGASSANSGSGTNSAGVLTNSNFVFLPVKLLSFTGRPQGGTAVLSWETGMEKNNDHFEIERSNDGGDFVTIGKVHSAGNSDVQLDYSFIDLTPFNGTNQYRLKQVDLDGTPTYSNTLAVEFQSENAGSFSIFPNPVTDAFTIRLQGQTTGTCVITVFDLSGKPIFSTSAQATGASIPVTLSRKPAPGIYAIVVRTQQQQLTGKILVK